MQTKTYTVAREGFLFGDFYKAGKTITLNEKQARPFLDEGRLKEKGARSMPKADKPAEKPKADAKAE